MFATLFFGGGRGGVDGGVMYLFICSIFFYFLSLYFVTIFGRGVLFVTVSYLNNDNRARGNQRT